MKLRLPEPGGLCCCFMTSGGCYETASATTEREQPIQCERPRLRVTYSACPPLRVGIVPLLCLLVILRQNGHSVMINVGCEGDFVGRRTVAANG